MPMVEGAGRQQSARSPSSDGIYSSDDEESNSVLPSGRGQRPMYPIPQSHWFPRAIAFRVYVPARGGRVQQQAVGNVAARASRQHVGAPRLHIQVTRPLAFKLTKDIVATYQTCNPEFQFSPDLNPKRYLTVPSTIVPENGLDNEKNDLVLYFNQVFVNDDGTRRYVVKDLVGSGTFGQVAKCFTEETNEYVAVKVIKNLPAYTTQARFEIGILHMLNKEYDPDDKYHIVRALDHFQYHGHLCIVFELLTENLYELLKKTNLKGMSLVLVRMFTKQLLESLSLLREARVIHCDLKPENILLIESFRSADLKLIDFGSACKEDQTVYTYIQSRFYRSPEVLVGHRYTTAIDMWSLGCVAAELFLGLPLFPGAGDFDMLLFMKEKLESQPSDHILRNAKYTNKFFKLLTAAPHSDYNHTAYQLLTSEEYEIRHKKKPEIGRRYFHGTLTDAIMAKPNPMPAAAHAKEIRARECFIDFLSGLIECDPRKRWSPQQAVKHPFITDEPYTGPYVPAPETPRTPVHHGLLLDHRGAAGHWVGAGLSPQVGGLNTGPRYDAISQQHSNHYSRASSFGSAGSFGSFGEGLAVDANFGSYVDDSGAHTTGISGQASSVGSSPESSWQGRPFIPSLHPHHQVLGQFRSLNLGASPSQFGGHGPLFQQSSGHFAASPGSFPSSPASSYIQSNGSQSQQGSPTRYGPASPARLLETAVTNATAAHGHYHRRRSWQPPPLSGGHGQQQQQQQQELAQWSRFQQSNPNGNTDAGPNATFDGQGNQRRGAPPVPHSRTARNGNSAGASQLTRASTSYTPGSSGTFVSPGSSMDGGDEDSALGPHWDPNFSEELLQEVALDTGGRGTSDGATSRRTSQSQASSSSSIEGSPVSPHSLPSGYQRQMPGHFQSQTSPSRLGPQISQNSQQQRQQGHHHVSPEQTPLHPQYGGRRQISGEMMTPVSGTASFQQRHQAFQIHQQQQLQQQLQHQLQHQMLLPSSQRDNRIPHTGVTHNTYSNAVASRLNNGQIEPNANSPSAAGFAMAAGIGHPMHAVQHQPYYGGEEIHHQWSIPGAFLPQGPYFANDLYGPRPPLARR
ncbi:hypothetical protein M758_11G031900 [Ceratodon purpureus]|nr:hypothetical protein M758_11G031900 [Ceratodon purpureus]